ncbi:unnamed protein product [Phaedon cochleariae]|uniref:Uncharacterized protein n=1 Tax=Phaedon cochleariae TaxID=80249 RepID=A0A9N9X117_PHACE|nr:unnamed protein product [Phaedon cochleariae]
MAAKPAPTPVSAAVSQIGLSKESLKHLKCGTCEGFLSVPPITMEKEGNYACGRCNSSGTRVLIYEELAKYMVFPLCRQTISDTRNLVLEEIAETVRTPCQNADKGCKYSGSVKSTKQHLMDCKYNFV